MKFSLYMFKFFSGPKFFHGLGRIDPKGSENYVLSSFRLGTYTLLPVARVDFEMLRLHPN